MAALKRNIGRSRAARFARAEGGVALIEFALFLPLVLLVFSVMLEASRTFWSFQSAISGVRDATRYLSRVVPGDICQPTPPGPGALVGYTATLTTIVSQSYSSTRSAFGTGVSVDSVTPTLACIAGSYRGGSAPVATVTAAVTITHPLAGAFTLFGAPFGPTTTTISDQARIYGQ
ncbi:TadE/TadG family type IV pilus assembly protein [Rhodovulum iodosum]|nr:TadE/TadG family type IV pilus assembly protein [Rhodovulum robiginosum]